MTLYQKYINWKNTPNRASLSLINAWAVLQAFFRKKIHVSKSHEEQIEWRKTQIRIECRQAGFCTFCGCDVEAKPYEDRPCEGFCYPNFMSDEDWTVYKEYLKTKTK